MTAWTEYPTAESAERYDLSSNYESLRSNPLIYPGRIPRHSFVYRQGLTWELSVPPGLRLTRALVRWREDDGRARGTPLVNALLRWGAAEATARIPVLAIGSNAYPRQLFDKFRDTFVDDTIPSLLGTLANIEVVFCPFVATYGYLPVTPRFRPGARSRAYLQLLSLSQMEVITRTESAYNLVALSAETAAFELADSLEVLPTVYVFWHAEVLRHFGDMPPICDGTLAEGAPHELVRRALSHQDLCERLLDVASVADADVLLDPSRRTILRDALLHRAASNPLPPGGRIIDDYAACEKYENARGTFSGVQASGLRVRRTGPERPRKGNYEPLAYLHEAEKGERRIGSHAVVFTRDASISANRPALLATVVRVVSSGDLPPGRVRPGEICLDQMARAAIGVAPGETCDVARLHVPWHQWLARVTGRVFGARALTGRAVRASETVMERPICWLEPAMMSALGIDPGGQVVVVGPRVADPPGAGFTLAARRLQALVPAIDQVADRKRVLHPDDPGARFPDPGEVLGVVPDLPWVWIDEQARNALGLLKMHPASAVTVRPSLWYLVLRAASRFVLATLGIGAALSLAVYRIWSTWFPAQQWLGLPMAEVASLAVLALTVIAASTAILANARRP